MIPSTTKISSYRLFVISLFLGIGAILLIRFCPAASPLATILIWPAFLSGANSVRELARYGLGTGTSSIGYWGAALGATAVYIMHLVEPGLGSFLGIGVAFLGGAITGLCAQKIIRMRIPVMIRESAMLAASTAVAISFLLELFPSCLLTISPLIYIAVTLAVIHPFNGSMGAGENKRRTIRLAAAEASMTTALLGSLAAMGGAHGVGLSVAAVSCAGFIIFAVLWFNSVKDDIYEIRWTGFPAEE